MINPFKYIPAVQNKVRYKLHYKESRWGYTIYNSKYELRPSVHVILVPKETHERVKTMIKPIDMKRYIELNKEIHIEMLKDFTIKVLKNDLQINMPKEYVKEYVKEYERVKKEWEIRINAAGGSTLMQFNAKTGLLGDNWYRMVQVAPNELNGKMDKTMVSYKKISWFRYLFVEGILDLMVQLRCKLNNFYYRKEIAIEHAKFYRESANIFLKDQNG